MCCQTAVGVSDVMRQSHSPRHSVVSLVRRRLEQQSRTNGETSSWHASSANTSPSLARLRKTPGGATDSIKYKQIQNSVCFRL